MWVECLIMREGPTPVELGNTRYMFMPLPDPTRKKGVPSTSIAEISADEHLEYLLKSKQFRPYVEGQAVVKEDVVDLSGYSIIKHQDGKSEGYRVETNDKGKPKQYAGSDGQWKKTTQGLVPFATEIMAWQWIKEEVENGADEKE